MFCSGFTINIAILWNRWVRNREDCLKVFKAVKRTLNT